MNQRRILTGFLNAALHQNQGVAIWFLPGQSEIQAILSKAHEIKNPGSFSEVSKEKGFVFAPFLQNQEQKILFLKSEKIHKGFQALSRFKTDQDYISSGEPSRHFVETKKDEYIDNCRDIIERIKKGDAEKIVLSRIKSAPAEKHPADILLQMKTEYPHAFCYLFFAPQTGLWMGATPETLIHEKSGKMDTMALAGTRKHAPEKPMERPWPAKEKEEQEYVTGFIRERLIELGINRINISAPTTAQAGTIEHIRTDFVIDSKSSNVNAGKIVEALHPTPAVCGQPQEAAYPIIGQIEKHSRGYYTGFLGPVNQDDETSIFVNLRCMKALGSNYLLFAGCGITAESDPEAEWDETELKAAVMEKVLTQA